MTTVVMKVEELGFFSQNSAYNKKRSRSNERDAISLLKRDVGSWGCFQSIYGHHRNFYQKSHLAGLLKSISTDFFP